MSNSQKYFRHQTAHDDLWDTAKRVYQGRRYLNPTTNQIYRFKAFMDYSIDGQVLVRNLTKNQEEFLSYQDWFSLWRLVPNKKRQCAQSKPKCKNLLEEVDAHLKADPQAPSRISQHPYFQRLRVHNLTAKSKPHYCRGPSNNPYVYG